MDLTREQLYEMVWLEPISVISGRLGVPTHILRKHCRTYNIPTPPSGYWTKLKYGQYVEKVPLPEMPNQEIDILASVSETDRFKIKEDAIIAEGFKIIISDDFRKAHYLTNDTLRHYRLKKRGQHSSLDSPILNLDVSEDNLRRALIIFDALVKSLIRRGHLIKIEHNRTYVEIEGKLIELAIREKMRSPGKRSRNYVYSNLLVLRVNHRRHSTVLALFQKHNDDVKKLIGISKSVSTWQKYERTKNHLEDFLKSKYRVSDISFKEINHMLLTDFEVYLKMVCKCNANTTAKFMQFFKRIVLIARNNGWIKTDPFVSYPIKISDVDRGYLTESEIKVIMEKQFPTKRLEQVRDIFIFSCFCGLAYIDAANLRKKNICKSFDGNLWIIGKREKTGVSFNIPLLDINKKILDNRFEFS